MGVGAAKPGELDTIALLGRVDAALYRAKHGGRDRVCVDGEDHEEPLTSQDDASETSERGSCCGPSGRWQLKGTPRVTTSIAWRLLVFSGPEGKRHRTFDDSCVTHSSESLQLPHSAPKALNRGFDHNDISGMDRLEISDLFDPEKVDQLLPVLGFGQNQDRADLRDGLGQDRRREDGGLTWTVREIPLVERDVLDPDDPLVLFELRDLVDEEEWVSVRKNTFDRRVVEREAEVCAHRISIASNTNEDGRTESSIAHETECGDASACLS